MKLGNFSHALSGRILVSLILNIRGTTSEQFLYSVKSFESSDLFLSILQGRRGPQEICRSVQIGQDVRAPVGVFF